MCSADPVEGGPLPLRLSLSDVTDRKSYGCAKTLPNGTVCETFREADASRGLLYDGREHYIAFEEAPPPRYP